jgi:topoisomerase-4 subunit B
LEGDDIREGLTAVISVRVPEKIIQYEGQTKNKLFTPEATGAVKKIFIDKFSF